MYKFVAVLLLAACGRQPRTVACDTQWIGMCHEWHQVDEDLAREVKEAVCNGSDEAFLTGPCPTQNVEGICTSVANQRTIYYRVKRAGDAAQNCAKSGGVWAAAK